MAPIISLPLVLVLLLGFLGLIAAMNRMSWRRDAEVQNLLREIGQRHGLAYQVTEGENERMIDYVERAIHNPVYGFELTVYTRHHPLQMDKKIMGGQITFTPPLPAGLSLVRRGPWSGTGLMTGDQRFDRAFFVEADDPEAALRLLSAPVREALADLERLVPEVEVTDERLTWSQYGALTDADRLDQIVDAMEAVAAAVRGAVQRLVVLEPAAATAAEAEEATAAVAVTVPARNRG